MIHWLNARRGSWLWDRKPNPALLTTSDFLVLAALDRSQARAIAEIAPHPSLDAADIRNSLHHLLQHGLVHRLGRNDQNRYKLSHTGEQFLADSLTTR